MCSKQKKEKKIHIKKEINKTTKHQRTKHKYKKITENKTTSYVYPYFKFLNLYIFNKTR